MSEDHEQQAAAAEREVADMEERSRRVGEHIEEARKDWDAKVADSAVPGAGGDPERAAEGGRHPETAYPGKGPEDEASDPDPADNDRGVDVSPGADDARSSSGREASGEHGGRDDAPDGEEASDEPPPSS
jgi:hypothetical protein